MKSNYLSVSSLFAQPGRYVVPLFQRPYVWTEDEQWKPLWEDVRRVAEDVVANKDILRFHFLGSVVLESKHVAAGHLTTREIVDGQQRLTTLQIFLKAGADVSIRLGATLAAGQLTDLVQNRHVSDDDSDGRFKVWPTEADQKAYAAVMDSIDGRIPEKFEDHIFAKAYRFFATSIEAWMGTSKGDSSKRAEALSTALHQQIKLMALDIDPNEDAQVIFETLNARGTPLLPIDLVKNWMLRDAIRKKLDAKKLYNKHWRQTFDQEIEFWREEIGRGHAQRPRADLFLQNYLTMRLQEEIPSDHLYYKFLDDVEKYKKEDIAARFETLENYAKVFRAINEPDEDTEIGRRFARINELDFITLYPLLMALRVETSNDELIAIIEVLESFIVRRQVCALTTRGYGTLFIDLMKAVAEGKKTETLQDRVIAFLTRSTAEVSRWPDDQEFQKAWLDAPLYEKMGRPRLRFILRALEEYMRKESGLTEPFAVPAKLEIEHVMPQAWEEYWPLPKDKRTDGKSPQRRREVIQTLGNLTLLTKKLNGTLSNAPWLVTTKKAPSKLATIKKYSLTMLSKDLVDHKEWLESDIRSRGKMLFGKASKIWIGPPQIRKA